MSRDSKKIYLTHVFRTWDDLSLDNCTVCGINKYIYYLTDGQKTPCLTQEEKIIKDIIK